MITQIDVEKADLVEEWVKVISSNREMAWLLAEAFAVYNLHYENPEAPIGHGVFPVWESETVIAPSFNTEIQDVQSLSKNICSICYTLLGGTEQAAHWNAYQEATIIIYSPVKPMFTLN